MRKAFPLQWCNNLSQFGEFQEPCKRHATMRKPAHGNIQTVTHITIPRRHTPGFGPFVRK
jgi:hypothetical protein